MGKNHTQALHFGMVYNMITMRQTKQRKGGTTDCSFKDNKLSIASQNACSPINAYNWINNMYLL